MNIKDIRQSILYQLDDIEDIKIICYTDRLYHSLCSSKDFWINWYAKHQLNYPGNTYDNPKDYILEYELVLKTNQIIDDIIKGKKSLYFEVNSDEINMSDLIYDPYVADDKLLRILKDIYKINFGYMFFSRDFSITYHANPFSILRYYVDKSTLFKFILNLLSTGMRIMCY